MELAVYGLPKSDRTTFDDTSDSASHRVAKSANSADKGCHLLGIGRRGAADGVIFYQRWIKNIVSKVQGKSDVTHLRGESRDGNAVASQCQFGESAAYDPRECDAERPPPR